MLDDRAKRFGVSFTERRTNRADIPMPGVDPGANSWTGRTVAQLRLEDVPVRNLRR
jgi:hypothetical protein